MFFFACTKFVAIPLTNASHMAKSKVRVEGQYQRIWLWKDFKNWNYQYNHLPLILFCFLALRYAYIFFLYFLIPMPIAIQCSDLSFNAISQQSLPWPLLDWVKYHYCVLLRHPAHTLPHHLLDWILYEGDAHSLMLELQK